MLRTTGLTALIITMLVVCVKAQDGAGAKDQTLLSSMDGGHTELINVSTYAFSAQSGIELEDMSGGTTQLIGPGTDNDNSVLAPIGFLFRYDGAFFTDFGVNGNGLLKIGGVTTTTSTINAINSVANGPKLMPYWDDLCVGNSGKVHYKTVGSPGNMKLVVEWKNMKISRGNACDGSGAGTFQVWIYDRPGVIQFVYGSGMTASSTITGGYSIGIQSGAATNFASVTTAGSSAGYTTANNTQTDAIAAGTSYLFTPIMPAAPSNGSSTGMTQSSASVNWTDNASDETAYLVRRTTDHVNFYFVGNVLAPNSTAFSETGLTPGTQYFYYVNALSEGAFSPDLVIPVTTNSPANISSTAAGGLWSAPSTWVGGAVPDVVDNVVIAGGATVIVDTAAKAGNVTVGGPGALSAENGFVLEGGSGAALRFGETAAFSLTVAHDVTIGTNDTFSTGGGSANQHVLSVGGNLVNNGTLDFSTNNNTAGATIQFTGATNNTFGGTGAVTDVMAIIVNKGISNANILELTVSNFTVRGSSTDTPASGYLFLYNGTFKISGSFTGTHRTFAGPAYDIPHSGGLWLNNPNYTVVAQNGSVSVIGLLWISSGTYNVGTVISDSLITFTDSAIVIQGGSINIAGGLGLSFNPSNTGFTYNQTGGVVTTCTAEPTSNAVCFDMGSQAGSAISMTGGDVVIQNATPTDIDDLLAYHNAAGVTGMNNIRGTTVHFGNALTRPGTTFRALGRLPNVVIDTTTGPHVLKFPSSQTATFTRNIDIGPGAVLDFSSFSMLGTSFINNGTLAPRGLSGALTIDDGTDLSDVTYSGAGIMSGLVSQLNIRCHTLAFDPAVGNIKTLHIKITSARLINAAKITIGNNDNRLNIVQILNGASLDMAPDFNIGNPGGESLVYSGTAVMGPEIKPDRVVANLILLDGPTSVTITGGDLTASYISLANGIIVTGPNTLTDLGGMDVLGGYVDGRLRRRLGPNVNSFTIGRNGRSVAGINVTNLIVNPSYATIEAIDTFMPGLLPANSASRYLKVETEGNFFGQVSFSTRPEDINGNQANYHKWWQGVGAPAPVNVDANGSYANPAGNWGVGEQLDPGPVSISGRVTTSTGNPIRNATVTVSGGGLPAPVIVFTGSLGTYVINGLQAGTTYTVQVSAKRYRFPPGGRQVTPFGNVANVDFAANPQEEF